MNQQVARELVKLLGVKNCIEVATLPASENDRPGFERVQLTIDVPLETVAQAMAAARAIAPTATSETAAAHLPGIGPVARIG